MIAANRRSSRCAVALFAALLVVVATRREARAETVTIGTLAPAASPWGQVYRVWQEAVKKKSDGRLELTFFYNGQQGDESAMVAKMQSGQLDGAALTSIGLGKIYRPVLALQIPGLFRTWDKLDAARDALAPELSKGIADAGFTLGGWGDVGRVRGFSKGAPVRVPEDLRGRKPFMWRDDVFGPILYPIVGGVNPVPLGIPEVLTSLNVGAIDVISAPALAVEQLQWASKLDNVSEESVVMAIGALVLSTKRIDALPADLRAILEETGKVAGHALSARIRKEDDAAFARLRTRMTVVSLSDAERARWAEVFRKTARRLAQGTFSPDLIARLVELAK